MRRLLICGAGGGLGAACTRKFLQMGDHVVATARHVERAPELLDLHQRHPRELSLLALDITDPASIANALEQTLGSSGHIDVLLNCSGIGDPGTIEGTSAQQQRRMFEVNFWGPLELMRGVLPSMRKRGDGRVIMVSSLSALVGMPCDGIYAASKAALARATEALRYEVAPFGVKVSIVVPGRFATPMLYKMADQANAPGVHEGDGRALTRREEDRDLQARDVYAPVMHRHVEELRANATTGDDPEVFAELLARISTDIAPRFSYPAGAQAESVCGKFERLDGVAREDLVMDHSLARWWRERGE